MAVRRIGFLDNFTGVGGGAGRQPYQQGPARGPRVGSPYGATAQPAPARPRVNTGFTAQSPQVQASLKANPQATFGPSPAVNYGAGQGQGRPSFEDPAITSDPALLRVKKLAQGQRDDAATSALARKKQLAIETGSDVLAREFGLDDTVAQTAAQNPLSILRVLRDQGVKEERAFNEDANKANLFFSGYRGEQLGELAKALLTAEAQAQARAREGFSGIESELLAATSGADRMEMDAELAAYERALAAGAGSEMVPLDLGGAGGAAGTGVGAGPSGQQRPGDDAGLIDPAAVQASLRANPEGTFGPSPGVDYGYGIDPLVAELLRPRRRDPLIDELLRSGGGLYYTD